MGLDTRQPHQLTHRDWTVLLCHPNGSIHSGDGCGLFVDDCRLISSWRLTVDGDEPEFVASDTGLPDEWQGAMRIRRRGYSPDGPRLSRDAIEIRLVRTLGRGIAEQLTVLNHSMVENRLTLRIELASDFADVLEVGQERFQQVGEQTLRARGNAVEIRYVAANGEHRTRRGLRVRRLSGDLAASISGRSVAMSATISLPPHGEWAAEIAYEPFVNGKWAGAVPAAATRASARRERERWQRRRPRVESTSATLDRVFDVAADDLYDLRNRQLEADAGEGWVVNAGLPLYTGLFGRDVLTAGWQGAMATTELLKGSLAITCRLQATDDDPWTDAEPGKLIHEMRRGPLADLRITAQAGYYGTQTTAAIFPLVLSELWHWTGDDSLLVRYRPSAERAVAWAIESAQSSSHGFLEYRQRSAVGIKNQAWKDSHDAIRYPDGRIVPNPIATVEEQAFHFLALCRMAEICVALDDDAAAERYLGLARSLREAWHDAFWMPDESFYAMALDPDGRQVRSISSNVGHALAAGIVPRELARTVAERLMAPDMFSGWGVRTLSSDHPSFNPWAYHLGSVWPVENATFALGFKRHGFDDLVEGICGPMLSAAAQLPGMRLPEVIGGQSRSSSGYPVAYPEANAPQAWSASATIQLVQIMLGLYPFAPLKVLALVRPRLPAGIDELTLRRVRVGDARVSLRLKRRPDGSAAHKVVGRSGTVLVVGAPPPDAASHEHIRETVSALALAKAPGRLARAGRIALGNID
jgi:glycogen debranching enzyme